MQFKTNHKQSGIATVLIVLLVGVALSASTLGVIYTVKSTQSKHIASHAKTNANSAAWMLAEAARNFLLDISPANRQAINDELDAGNTVPISLNIDAASPIWHLRNSTIVITDIMFVDGTAQYQISITAIDLNSQSRSDLEVVVDFSPGQAEQECKDSLEPHLAGDVEIGDQALRSHGAQNLGENSNNRFSVDGSWGNGYGEGSSIEGIEYFSATGSISLDGTGNGSTIKKIHANDDVFLADAVKVDIVHTKGSLELTRGYNQNITEVIAEEDIHWRAYSGSESLIAHNNLYAYRSGAGENGHKLLVAGLKIEIGNTSEADYKLGAAVPVMESHGSIEFVVNEQNHGRVHAQGNIVCPNNSTFTFGDITSGSNISEECTTAGANSSNLNIRALPDVPAVEIAKSTIADADGYLENTNFVFTYEQTAAENERLQVAVKNYNGIEDGQYVLYQTGFNNKIYKLGNTRSPNTDPTICNSNSNDACIKFFPNDRIDDNGDLSVVEGLGAALFTELNGVTPPGTWQITGNSVVMVPGVFYFDRDLNIRSNERLINGFLSAGNITTKNSAPTIIAPNAAPFEALCQNKSFSSSRVDNELIITTGANNRVTTTVVASDNSANQLTPYPKNFCTFAGTGEATENKVERRFIGQFALMAGQQDEVTDPEADPDENYRGGDIYFNTSFDVFGRIIAGNALKLIQGANLHVFGTFGSEARREGKENVTNIMTGSIDLYPDAIEAITGGSKECEPQGATPNASNLVWARYL